MSKVTLEITPQGWTQTLEHDGKTYIEQHVYREKSGQAERVKGRDLDTIKDIPPDLAGALESFFAFEVCNALAGRGTANLDDEDDEDYDDIGDHDLDDLDEDEDY